MASIFTRIVNGEIPCYKVAEDENYLAFLDINPQAKGHTLVIPKKEIDYYFDLPGDELCGLTLFSKKVAVALKKVVPCLRVGVSIIGIDVPHVHIHLIPFNNMGDLTFSQKENPLNAEEMQALATEIAKAV